MTKTKPLLLAGASVLLCASSLIVFVLEIDRAIAWIAPGSPRHNNRYHNNRNQNQIQNQNRVVFLFSAFDERSTERLHEPQPPLPAAGQFSKAQHQQQLFFHGLQGRHRRRNRTRTRDLETTGTPGQADGSRRETLVGSRRPRILPIRNRPRDETVGNNTRCPFFPCCFVFLLLLLLLNDPIICFSFTSKVLMNMSSKFLQREFLKLKT